MLVKKLLIQFSHTYSLQTRLELHCRTPRQVCGGRIQPQQSHCVLAALSYLVKIAQHPFCFPLLSSALLVQDFDVSFTMLLLYSLGAEKWVISLIVVDTVLQPPCAQTSAQKLHTAPGEY